MRDIKFRAWDGIQKSWNYLYLERGGVRFGYTSNAPIPENITSWQQYTGLKDKNGKEIYEGDILLVVEKTAVEQIEGHTRYEDEGLLAEIIFDDGVFAMKADNVLESEFLWEYSIYGEVVGNIYENPELIK